MEPRNTGIKRRTIPRPFSYHWGSGQIVEEASFAGQYHEPAIQLLEYEDGSLSVRFCFYNHTGHFQRSPLMVSEEELAALRDELSGCPRLRDLLRQLLD